MIGIKLFNFTRYLDNSYINLLTTKKSKKKDMKYVQNVNIKKRNG